MSGCTLPEGRHYAVVSGEVCTFLGSPWGGYGEPSEYGRCFAIVAAPNRRQARVTASRLKEFEPWVNERRGDGKVPFGGLDVEETVCDHGVCWACEEACDACLGADLEAV